VKLLKVSGLVDISQKFLRWFEIRAERVFDESVNIVKNIHDSMEEKEQLNKTINSLRQQLLECNQECVNERNLVSQLECTQKQSEHETHLAKIELMKSVQNNLEGKDIMKRLLRDVRQYLHLTQLEVKRKFGYVP